MMNNARVLDAYGYIGFNQFGQARLVLYSTVQRLLVAQSGPQAIDRIAIWILL
jgi:hypothetical protein